MSRSETCGAVGCDWFPQYGVAPHECYWRKGSDFIPGQSTLLPAEEWPDNFLLEVLEGEQPEDVQYPNACGVYFCPSCKRGMEAARDPNNPNILKQFSEPRND